MHASLLVELWRRRTAGQAGAPHGDVDAVVEVVSLVGGDGVNVFGFAFVPVDAVVAKVAEAATIAVVVIEKDTAMVSIEMVKPEPMPVELDSQGGEWAAPCDVGLVYLLWVGDALPQRFRLLVSHSAACGLRTWQKG